MAGLMPASAFSATKQYHVKMKQKVGHCICSSSVWAGFQVKEETRAQLPLRAAAMFKFMQAVCKATASPSFTSEPKLLTELRFTYCGRILASESEPEL